VSHDTISNCLRRWPTEKQFTCATYLCELRYGFKVVLEVGVLRSSYLVLDVTSMTARTKPVNSS